MPVVLYAAPDPYHYDDYSHNIMRYAAIFPKKESRPAKKKKFNTFVPGDSRLHILGIGGRIICVDTEGEYSNIGSAIPPLDNGALYIVERFIEKDNVITYVRVKGISADYDVCRFIPAPPTPEELARDKSRVNLIDFSNNDSDDDDE